MAENQNEATGVEEIEPLAAPLTESEDAPVDAPPAPEEPEEAAPEPAPEPEPEPAPEPEEPEAPAEEPEGEPEVPAPSARRPGIFDRARSLFTDRSGLTDRIAALESTVAERDQEVLELRADLEAATAKAAELDEVRAALETAEAEARTVAASVTEEIATLGVPEEDLPPAQAEAPPNASELWRTYNHLPTDEKAEFYAKNREALRPF